GLVIQIIRLQKLVDQLWAKKLPGQTVLSRTSPRGRNVQIFSVGLPPGGFDLPSAVTPTELPHWSVEFKPGAGFIEQVSVSKTAYYIAVVALAALTIILMGATCSYALRRYRDEPTSAQEKEQHQRNKVAEDFDEQSYLVDLPLEAIGRYAEDEPADNIDEFMEEAPPEAPESLPDVVFRQYDIRGIYGSEITADFAFELGAAFASLALESGEDTLITGYDGRTSSPDLHQSLEQGILSTGCNVMALGAVTTPMFNLATHTRKETRSGIMVTASHNPPEYNGFKFCLDKSPLTAEAIQNLKTRMTEKNFREGLGETAQYDHITSDYLGAISENVMPANSLKVVVDAANGIAGSVAPDVLTLIGCEVIPLFCDVDGTFPNHPPDTSEEQNLVSLREAVLDHQADLGIALDGDGDRVVAISASGRIVWPDELLMIFARDMLARLPGSDIVFDVKSTRRLNKLVSNYGGRPVVYKTGHSNIRQKTRECDSPLGGEYSGHIFFRDRWHGFDDGLYAAVRLIEIITTREQPLDEIVEGFGQTFATPEIKIPVPEEAKFKLIEDLQEKCEFKNATVNRIDGLRVDYPKAWGLVRASNTSPALTLRFEADSAESLENIQSLFRKQISSIDARLTF
ncbi:MAG: phosphomannomutase/phosphoglucomutase, partial [bacterium]